MSSDRCLGAVALTCIVTCIAMVFLTIQLCYGSPGLATKLALEMEASGATEGWVGFGMFVLLLGLVMLPHVVILLAAFKMRPSRLGSWVLWIGTLILSAFGLTILGLSAVSPPGGCMSPAVLFVLIFVVVQSLGLLPVFLFLQIAEAIARRRQSTSPQI